MYCNRCDTNLGEPMTHVFSVYGGMIAFCPTCCPGGLDGVVCEACEIGRQIKVIDTFVGRVADKINVEIKGDMPACTLGRPMCEGPRLEPCDQPPFDFSPNHATRQPEGPDRSRLTLETWLEIKRRYTDRFPPQPVAFSVTPIIAKLYREQLQLAEHNGYQLMHGVLVAEDADQRQPVLAFYDWDLFHAYRNRKADPAKFLEALIRQFVGPEVFDQLFPDGLPRPEATS